MKIKITEKKERDIEYCTKAAMYFFGVGLGSAALVNIWNTLGLIDSWGWALQVVSILFLATATAAFCFEVKHLYNGKRK